MEFLGRIFFDNTIAAYLGVIAGILFVLFFRRIVSRYIAGFICKIVQRHWPDIKKEQFIELIINPLNGFLLITSVVVLLGSLHFPSALDYGLFNTTFHVIFQKIAVALLIFAIVRLLSRILKFISLVIQQHHVEKEERAHFQLLLFFKDFIRAMIYIIGLIILLKFVFEVDIKALVGGLGIAGAALALAGRESIENIIASFIIFLDKPFYAGDLVKVNSYTGTVEKIGLRSTRIRTSDKTLITVPNKQMVDRVLDNLSFRTQRRAEVVLELVNSYSAEELSKFRAGFAAIMSKHESAFKEHSLFITEYNKDAVIIKIEFFTAAIPVAQFNLLKETILLELVDYMHKNNIEFTSSKNSIILQQPVEESDTKPAGII